MLAAFVFEKNAGCLSNQRSTFPDAVIFMFQSAPFPVKTHGKQIFLKMPLTLRATTFRLCTL